MDEASTSSAPTPAPAAASLAARHDDRTWPAPAPAPAAWATNGTAAPWANGNGAGSPAALPATIRVNWLLEFRDRSLEASYSRYTRSMHLRIDLFIVAINVFVVMTALVQQQRGRAPVATPAPPLAAILGALSAAQSLMLLALMLRSPRSYTSWRAALIAGTRLYRLAVWALYLPQPRPASGAWDLLSVRLFLLSPAGGSLWFTLVFPLPLPLHMRLLAVTALVAGWRGRALCASLAELPGVGRQALAAHARLNAMSRLLELPAHKLIPASLLQAADDRNLSATDATARVYAFVVVMYGLLLPLLLLYMKDMHFRVRFLSLLGPSAGRQQLLAGARSQMYSITLSVAFMALSLLPCAWNALQLLPIAVRKAHEEPAAAALAAGALLLDVLMRFWLLSALMCAINVSVVPVVQRVSQGIIHVLHGVAASLVTRHHAQQR